MCSFNVALAVFSTVLTLAHQGVLLYLHYWFLEEQSYPGWSWWPFVHAIPTFLPAVVVAVVVPALQCHRKRKVMLRGIDESLERYHRNSWTLKKSQACGLYPIVYSMITVLTYPIQILVYTFMDISLYKDSLPRAPQCFCQPTEGALYSCWCRSQREGTTRLYLPSSGGNITSPPGYDIVTEPANEKYFHMIWAVLLLTPFITTTRITLWVPTCGRRLTPTFTNHTIDKFSMKSSLTVILYTLLETIDVFTLMGTIISNPGYFIANQHIYRTAAAFLSLSLVAVNFGPFFLLAKGHGDKNAKWGRALVILLINVPLLVIRFSLIVGMDMWKNPFALGGRDTSVISVVLFPEQLLFGCKEILLMLACTYFILKGLARQPSTNLTKK